MDSSHGMRPSGQEHVVGEEYTFTDRELQDILVFLEYTNKPGAPKLEPSNLPHIPPVLGRGSPTFIASQLPMQFQPHMPPHASQHTSPTTLPPHSFNPVKQEHHAISQGPAPMHVQYRLAGAMPPVSAAPSISMGLMPSMNGMANIPVYHQSLSMRELYNPSHTAASAGPVTSAQLPQTSTAIPTSSQSPKPAGPAAEKPQISHSTVEKQRRDRINNLIDELRELVPPQNMGNGTSEGGDAKRAKHVVLSDTIALLKKMQAQLPRQMKELSRMKVDEAAMPIDSDGQPISLLGLNLRSSSSNGDAMVKRENGHDLPMPPKNQTANGVVVEEAEGCLLVKVNCKDRRGLLSDVISSLKALDLQIKTAAITTTSDGTVHDVFEVIPDPSLTAEEIQCHVHSGVYSRFNSNDKRMRGHDS